jgi:tryptophan 2,3-dioxygenase
LAHSKSMSYDGYLNLQKLLTLQKPLSKPRQHDETLFIIAHQTYELWFKLILNELERCIELMVAGNYREASRLLGRVVAVEKILTQQLEVLETIRSTDFFRFRDVLRPASGFQSAQFREIEFISGQRDERYLDLHKNDRATYARLKRRFNSPSLWDGFRSALERSGFKLGSPGSTTHPTEKEMAAVVKVYTERRYPDLLELAEALLEYDKQFWLWRNHHMGMVERVIGRKPGTGVEVVKDTVGPYSFDSSGVSYLKTTLRRRFYPALWAARGRLPEG